MEGRRSSWEEEREGPARAPGLWSFGANELPGMPGPCTGGPKPGDDGHNRARARATKEPLSLGSARPARATARAGLAETGEHRNAGRIALSPAGRRSISYEYRCPWRYTTGASGGGGGAVFSQKYMYRTPAYMPERRLLLPLRARTPAAATPADSSEMSREPVDEDRDW